MARPRNSLALLMGFSTCRRSHHRPRLSRQVFHHGDAGGTSPTRMTCSNLIRRISRNNCASSSMPCTLRYDPRNASTGSTRRAGNVSRTCITSVQRTTNLRPGSRQASSRMKLSADGRTLLTCGSRWRMWVHSSDQLRGMLTTIYHRNVET